MRTAGRKPITKGTTGLVLWALATAAGCDRLPSGGTAYRVGHGVTVWHQVPAGGGFLPWAFRVTTPASPDSGAPYVALERVGPSARAEMLVEAPLPEGATRVPVDLEIEHGHAVLRVGPGGRFEVAEPLPLCCGGTLAMVASPRELPRDSAGALVLQYEVSERLARSDSASFEVARRREDARYLRLRFAVRP
jgi:hypothetical protein